MPIRLQLFIYVFMFVQMLKEDLYQDKKRSSLFPPVAHV